MRHLRSLLWLMLCLLGSLGSGQDFQLNVIREFRGAGSRGLPVMIGGKPFAVIGGFSSLALASSDRFVQFSVTTAPNQFHADFALARSSSTVVVAGRIRVTNPQKDQIAVFQIDIANERVDWSFIEPQRSVSTRPLDIIDTGISLVLAAAVEGGVAAIALNPSNGVEQYRTGVSTTLREASVARDGRENVYLLANRITSAGPRLFIRSVDAAGFFRWEREYPLSGTGYRGFSFTIPLLAIARDAEGRRLHILEFDEADGRLVRSLTHSGGNSLDFSPPVTFLSAGELLLTFFESGRRQLIKFTVSTFTGAIQGQNVNVVDQSVAQLAGVPVFHVQNRSTLNMELHPQATWARTEFPTGVSIQSHIITDPLRNRLITVLTEPLNAVPQLVEIVPRPIARDDSIDAFFTEQQVTFDPTDNDIAATGADIEILSQPEGGTVSQNNDGTLTFTASAAKHQTEAFTYRLIRGNMSSIATVKIFRQPIGVGIELSASRVKGGTVVTGKVLMSGPRQGAPQALALSENTAATALASPTVQLLPGKTESEIFTILTARVRNPVSTAITASEGNSSVEELAFLDIDPPFLTNIEAVKTTVVGGAPAQFRLILDAPAPTNGMPIAITDDSTAILVPSTAVVPAGLTAGIFSAPTAVVTSSKTATVTASSNGVTKSVTIAIVGVSLALNPTSVVGGQNSTGTITLTSNAIINSVFFDVTDNSPATAPDPATAVVPAGTRVGTFNIITAPVTSTRTSTISIANGGVVRSASLTVRVAALQSLVVSPAQVVGGSPYAGLITLDGKAAGTGVTVGLTSANPIVQVPASQLISAGNTQALFVGSTTRPTTTLMIVITASLNGITRPTTLIVSP